MFVGGSGKTGDHCSIGVSETEERHAAPIRGGTKTESGMAQAAERPSATLRLGNAQRGGYGYLYCRPVRAALGGSRQAGHSRRGRSGGISEGGRELRGLDHDPLL